MMTLADASRFFDRTPVFDSFTMDLLFNGQIEPFEESRRDAYSGYRRTLSVAPGTPIPDHRTIHALGTHWLVGQLESDGMADLHRQKYVLVPADKLLRVSTLDQYLQGAFGSVVRGSTYWVKDLKQPETSSEQPQMFDVFLSAAVPPYSVVWQSGEAFLVSSPRPLASGVFSAFSLKLRHSVETGVLVSRRFVPSRGGYEVEGSPDVPMLRVRWQSLFEHDSQLDARYHEGDVSVVIPGEHSVRTSSAVELAGVSYQVLNVDTIGGANVAHCRRGAA